MIVIVIVIVIVIEIEIEIVIVIVIEIAENRAAGARSAVAGWPGGDLGRGQADVSFATLRAFGLGAS